MEKIFNERLCNFPGCEIIYRPSAPAAIYCSPTHEVECESCEEIFETRSGKGRRALCKKCVYSNANKKRKETLLELYGVENQFQRPEVKERMEEQWRETYGGHPSTNSEVKKKMKETNLERYGGVAPASSPEILEKIKETNRERYGVDWSTQSTEMIEKSKATSLERYGVEVPLNSPEIQEKVRKTNLELYGVENQFQRETIKARTRELMRERYGSEHALQVPEFLEKASISYAKAVANGGGNSSRISKINRAWGKLIEETFGIPFEIEARYGDYFADLSLRNGKTLIEINPTISHNSHRSFSCITRGCAYSCEKHKAIDQGYHLAKAKAAQELNLKLIQIYDWDSKASVLRLLAGHLGAGWEKHSARKLRLAELTPKEANSFLKLNHIQGGVKGQTACFGLFQGENLLAVATFGKARFGNKAQWEFLRYAVGEGHIIHGGANRLWEAFIAKERPKTVSSYVDFDHSTKRESFLLQLGFSESPSYAPVLVWSKGKKVVKETSLLALGADRLLKTNYGSPEKSGL